MPNLSGIVQYLCYKNGIFEKLQENSKSKKVTKRDKIMKKKIEKILRHYLGTIQMQLHTKFGKERQITLAYIKIISLTSDRQTTDTKFLLQFLSPRGPNRTEKSFSTIGRKRILKTVAIYVLWDFGHITNLFDHCCWFDNVHKNLLHRKTYQQSS